MAVQNITTRFVADFSDYEQFSDVLRRNASDAGVAEKEVKQYSRSIADQANEIARVEKAFKAEQREVKTLTQLLDKATDPKDVQEYTKALEAARARMGALGEEAKQVGAFSLKGTITQVRGALTEGLKGGTILGGLTSAATALGPVGAAVGAIGAAVFKAGDAFVDLQNRVAAARTQVQKLTGATGEELTAITAAVQAVSDTYDQEFNQTLITSNAVAKAFGISQTDALDQIGLGLAAGLDLQGDYLDQLREYGTFYASLGLTIEQTNALIAEGQAEGVYSDKFSDALKEAAISLRELTPATEDALRGIGFTQDEISAAVQDGTITSFNFIQEISKRTVALGEDTRAAGTIYADVFRGAGEDAGKLATILANTDALQRDLNDTLTETGERQRRLQAVNTELEIAYNAIFEAGGSAFANIGEKAEVFGKEILVDVINGVVDLANWFIDLYNKSRPVQVGLAFGFAQIKTAIDVVVGAVKQGINVFQTLGEIAVAAINPFDDNTVEDAVKRGLDRTAKIVSDTASDIAENYQGVFDPKKIELIDLDARAEAAKVEQAAEAAAAAEKKATEERTARQQAAAEAAQKAFQGQQEKLRAELEKTEAAFSKFGAFIATDGLTQAGTAVEDFQSRYEALSTELERLELQPTLNADQIEAAKLELEGLQDEFDRLATLEEAVIQARIQLADGTTEGLRLQFEQDIQGFQDSIGLRVPISLEAIDDGDQAAITQQLIGQGLGADQADAIAQSLLQKRQQLETAQTELLRTQADERIAIAQAEAEAFRVAFQDAAMATQQVNADADAEAALAFLGEVDALRAAREQQLITEREYQSQLLAVKDEFAAKQATADEARKRDELKRQRDQVGLLEAEIARLVDQAPSEERNAKIEALQGQVTEAQQRVAELGNDLANLGDQGNPDTPLPDLERIAAGLEFTQQALGETADAFSVYYERRIDAAEGNEREQERLAEESAKRQKQIANLQARIEIALMGVRLASYIASGNIPQAIATGIALTGALAKQAIIRATNFREGIRDFQERELNQGQRRKLRIGPMTAIDAIPGIAPSGAPIRVDWGERIVSRATNSRYFDDFNALEDGLVEPGLVAALAKGAVEVRTDQVADIAGFDIANPDVPVTAPQLMISQAIGGPTMLDRASIKSMASEIASQIAWREDEGQEIARRRGALAGATVEELATAIARKMATA